MCVSLVFSVRDLCVVVPDRLACNVILLFIVRGTCMFSICFKYRRAVLERPQSQAISVFVLCTSPSFHCIRSASSEVRGGWSCCKCMICRLQVAFLTSVLSSTACNSCVRNFVCTGMSCTNMLS
ncbi:hypothetical protein DUNSADRAFT_15244 [Dunaliella salina]|uniref:Secreted protein n=1 Tax=Dunaliella salina TaxID=3046 RepID=A0ABQ7H1Y8_DUNSA|nr:hypothetical protein DUNSADRAFT_15244 [Dunaliella salina]|eukprot:KAF5840876.1 hypothetical protein DUNSADRAFT_15244 [Dunaliella salina]